MDPKQKLFDKNKKVHKEINNNEVDQFLIQRSLKRKIKSKMRQHFINERNTLMLSQQNSRESKIVVDEES